MWSCCGRQNLVQICCCAVPYNRRIFCRGPVAHCITHGSAFKCTLVMILLPLDGVTAASTVLLHLQSCKQVLSAAGSCCCLLVPQERNAFSSTQRVQTIFNQHLMMIRCLNTARRSPAQKSHYQGVCQPTHVHVPLVLQQLDPPQT